MTTNDRSLLTAQEVAARLRINIRTLQRLEDEKLLTPLRIGRAVRYRPADVQAFIDSQKAAS